MTSGTKAGSGRHTKGVTLVDLIKVLRHTRKTRPLPAMSPEGEELLEAQILVSQWYPFEPLLELIEIVDSLLLKHDESYALEMGIIGGTKQLQGAHKVYVHKGDTKATLMAMRISWRSHFDFGELGVEITDDHTAVFTLKGYEDVPAAHAMMIVGWDVAAARLAGSPEASGEVIERPWQGAPHLRYLVRF